jgi:outer membrane immunogenic protein
MNSKLSGACIAIPVILASSIGAHAADLTRPDYKAPAYVAPAAGWAGWYVGLNAGYAFGTSNLNTVVSRQGNWFTVGEVAAIAAAGAGSASPKGFTGGIQLGYNWQWNRVVFGLEADANAFMLKGSASGTAPDPIILGNNYVIDQQIKTDWLATVRPRIGYAFDNFLVYVTGGAAATQLKYNVTYAETTSGATSSGGSASKLKIGWTAGLGAEYALWQRWSLKAEYLYVDLGSVSADTNVTGPLGQTGQLTSTADLKAHIVRVGVNYRF